MAGLPFYLNPTTLICITPRPPRSCRWKIRLFNYKQGLTEGILGAMGGGRRVRDIWAFYRRLLQTAYAGIFSEPSSVFGTRRPSGLRHDTEQQSVAGITRQRCSSAKEEEEEDDEEATNASAILLFSIYTSEKWPQTVCLCLSLQQELSSWAEALQAE